MRTIPQSTARKAQEDENQWAARSTKRGLEKDKILKILADRVLLEKDIALVEKAAERDSLITASESYSRDIIKGIQYPIKVALAAKMTPGYECVKTYQDSRNAAIIYAMIERTISKN